MIQTRRSQDCKNPDIKEISRRSRESNVAWLQRIMEDDEINPEKSQRDNKYKTHVLLFGGSDLQSFRFRLSQAHVRHDLSPSSWSHAVLLHDLNPDSLNKAQIISVGSVGGEWYSSQKGFAPKTNGIQSGKLDSFKSASDYPNIALLAIPVDYNTVLDNVVKLREMRLTVDFSELLLRWLQYAWGVGQISNPLQEGYGFPDACMIDTACTMASFDISPGVESKICCPETIWQTALYWTSYAEHQSEYGSRIVGRFARSHKLVETDNRQARWLGE